MHQMPFLVARSLHGLDPGEDTISGLIAHAEKNLVQFGKKKCVSENQFHATVIKELGVNFVIDSSKDLCWLIDVQE